MNSSTDSSSDGGAAAFAAAFARSFRGVVLPSGGGGWRGTGDVSLIVALCGFFFPGPPDGLTFVFSSSSSGGGGAAGTDPDVFGRRPSFVISLTCDRSSSARSRFIVRRPATCAPEAPSSSPFSASPSSSADPYRSSGCGAWSFLSSSPAPGSFASARSNASPTSTRATFSITFSIELPWKSASPVSISKSTEPRENRSDRPSRSLPSTCSGLMYDGVPRITPCAVSAAHDAVARAMPKSITLTTRCWETIRFPGLMSRWTMVSGCPVASSVSPCA